MHDNRGNCPESRELKSKLLSFHHFRYICLYLIITLCLLNSLIYLKFNDRLKSLYTLGGQITSMEYFQIPGNLKQASGDQVAISPIKFDFDSDLLIFVHAQRTGGSSFDRFLTDTILSRPPCECAQLKSTVRWREADRQTPKLYCQCVRPKHYSKLRSHTSWSDSNDDTSANLTTELKPDGSWLYTRSTHNWQYCGIHATFAQLQNCVPWLIEFETELNRSIIGAKTESKLYIHQNICIGIGSNTTESKDACDYMHKTGAILKGIKFIGLNKTAGNHLVTLKSTKRRYVYITKLRNPIARFLSEYELVKVGATWKDVYYPCGGRMIYAPKCYNGSNWRNVSLRDFMDCPLNFAANRMTRHLADVEDIGCYDNSLNLTASEYESLMLKSAKRNLRTKIQFYGLVEYPQESEALLKAMLGVDLKPRISKLHSVVDHELGILDDVIDKIAEINELDVKLYNFGVKLFWQRYQKYVSADVL